ncbi:D-alanyl-D-alanine carboxypeptidase family protein [Kineococcus rubinsiae]|uniref:D-alanyl-D-alanine carboxypeptidase family protein n=1 Tax=Kineococcus rubinsiae TaxID=2609562 RepID=UPI001AD9383C|nr:M15 family metallopeptidase [Kineococcus rubinsiae]
MLLSPRLRHAVLLTTAAVGSACLTLGVGAHVPAASAATVAPVALTAAVPAAVPVAVPVVDPPTPEQVEQARQAAAAAAAAAVQAQAQLTAAQAQLDALATQANAALERYQVAKEGKEAAEREEAAQRQRLAQAEVDLAQGKKDLGQWASQAYRGGGTLQEYSGMVTMLQEGATDDAASALASVKRIGDGRNNAVEEYAAAQRIQADATTRAAAAAAQARAHADEAVLAKEQSDRLVAEQRAQVAALAVLQASATGTASSEQERATNLATARAAADAMAAAATAQGLIGAVGDCTGASTTGYGNGLIPRSALCPLWGASSHVLRADAANAFNQLSQAYAQAFGTPLSVTDSYRTLAGQIDVAARKPGLAAKAGTSRHGLGIAVDLGGGVQTFGSPQFLWLKRNAALFGWLHPAWAEERGGKFEPWHWEYQG